MEYTLTYSEGVKGWVSFYSYNPDWMIGMNQYFYTFKGGNLFRHNINTQRNTFYGTFMPSSIESVFNTSPLENKLFKTLNLEGDNAWSATLETDLQNTGHIEKLWFEKKEEAWFAFIRNSGSTPALLDNYALRSLNGIGKSVSVSGSGVAVLVNFSISPLIEIGSIASIGDNLYFALPPYTTPQYAGVITGIDINYPSGLNRITIDTTVIGTVLIPIQNAYFLYIKSSIAESHGVLGHYCKFSLENDSIDKVELFAVESTVMKSYP